MNFSAFESGACCQALALRKPNTELDQCPAAHFRQGGRSYTKKNGITVTDHFILMFDFVSIESSMESV